MKFTSGLPETACGLGSTLKTTETIRMVLPYVLRQLGIRSLLDAPCGDGNWISKTNLRGVSYIAVDNSHDHLCTLLARPIDEKMAPFNRTIQHGDILNMALPRADAIMCRDFFQHLPTEAACSVIERAKKARYDWLIATSFNCESNIEIGPEMFRPLNLRLAPFHLNEPAFEIPDPPGSGRVLGVWRL